MKLGTVIFSDKAYNLDGMSLDEMKNLLREIEEDKKQSINNAKNMIRNVE